MDPLTVERHVPSYGDAEALTPEEFEQEARDAEAAGFTVLLADDHTLLLDLDGTASYEQFAHVRSYVLDLFGFDVEDEWESKSGSGHVHVVMRSKLPYPLAQRIALQAMLGSDPVREALSLARSRNGVEESVRLFKPPAPARMDYQDDIPY